VSNLIGWRRQHVHNIQVDIQYRTNGRTRGNATFKKLFKTKILIKFVSFELYISFIKTLKPILKTIYKKESSNVHKRDSILHVHIVRL